MRRLSLALLTFCLLAVLAAASANAGRGLGHGSQGHGAGPGRGDTKGATSSPATPSKKGKKPQPPQPSQPTTTQSGGAADGDVAVTKANGQAQLDMQGVLIANIRGKAVLKGTATVSGSCQHKASKWSCNGSFSATGQFQLVASGQQISLSAVGRGTIRFQGTSGVTTVNGSQTMRWTRRANAVQFGN